MTCYNYFLSLVLGLSSIVSPIDIAWPPIIDSYLIYY
ncbi:hypothetical protein TMEN_6491 [Trichophyton mentagrophytes]|nr:hypothetical protein TMEN_6491 [Trichophyton mentagrophytes]